MPKVLISDQMDPKAAEIFRANGVEVDEKPGLSKDELKAIIGDYDGLAIRSATKVTADLLEAADQPEGDRPRRHRRRQCRYPGRHRHAASS